MLISPGRRLDATTRLETEGSVAMQAGDRVEVEANPGADVTKLVAVVVQSEH